jgi:hypothetical protein
MPAAMKKTRTATTKQLKLSREAIRMLAASTLSEVIGGRRNDDDGYITCDAGATCKPT